MDAHGGTSNGSDASPPLALAAQDRPRPRVPYSPAALFDLLWESLADVMGTGATATLLRRALRRGSVDAPRLNGLVVHLDGLQYTYRLPNSWHAPRDAEALADLRALFGALRPLLEDLTGPVVVARLERIGPLSDAGVFSGEQAP